MADNEGSRGFVVVIAVDKSVHATKAVEWYVAMAHRPENSVVLAHIPEYAHTLSATASSSAVTPDVWKDILKREEENVKALQTTFNKKLEAYNISVKWNVVTDIGHAGEGITRVAKEENANLIVMGTRGQGTIRRTILGSASDYVLHHAHAPVAICRH